jgi:hypothetical protein
VQGMFFPSGVKRLVIPIFLPMMPGILVDIK